MIRKLFENRKRSAALVVSLLLLVCVTVGGTLAFLVDTTAPVENTFVPTSVPPTIVEEIEGNVKKQVAVKNSGDIPAYIRARVVVTWQDELGNVYSEAPMSGTDYSMTIPGDSKWFKIGDYYYYTEKVPAGAETNALLKEGKVLPNAYIPSGYKLHMEILAQTVQAEPKDAVEYAWTAIKVVDGKLAAK